MNGKFIGTGTMGSVKKANTSILIDNILFDCGMGTIKQLEKLGNRVKDLDYVVISHFHADHFFDLPNLIIGKKIRKELDKKIYIVGPTGIKQKTYDMMILSFGDLGSLEDYANIEFIELEPNTKFNFNEYTLTTYELKHGNATPNFGYLLEKENKVIGYTGDSTLCDNFYKMCEKANYMIVDTCMQNESNPAHIGLSDLLAITDNYMNCKFYSVHRSDYEVPNTDKVLFPNDGDTFDIN